MAPPLSACSCRGLIKVLSVLLLLLAFAQAHYSHSRPRRMLQVDDEDQDHHHHPPMKKIMKDSNSDTSSSSTSLSTKNKTKLLKSTIAKNQTSKVLKSGFGLVSPKNQTKLKISSSSYPVSISSSKNKTKLSKPNSESVITNKVSSSKNKTKLLKPNSESVITNKISSSKNKTKLLKPISESVTINKISSSKNKTKLIKPISMKPSKNSTKTSTKSSDLPKPTSPSSQNRTKSQVEKKGSSKTSESKSGSSQNVPKPFWIDDGDDDDLIAEFRDMPSKFQQTLLPDLERISRTSKVYMNKANREITNNFKPIVGNKYAPAVASIISLAFILIPLVLVSLIFNRFKAYFSLQKFLIFVQIYLSIYFSILCLSSLVTGLEPLRFFYATSQSTYICIQLLQTLAYVLYLLLLLMYMALVFSTETGPASKLIGLVQTLVGFTVGLHYYMAVFHRAVLRQPPKTSWRVHGIYAACFLAISLLTQAERRKKAYVEEGGGDGKKS
ncbi:unnamed protein product [Cuscuta campestris]|uniref:Uncharacterized protein n=1 Tax=Cuscuta campestris TaxID=132261 RepID=A0A484N9L1_9ASTE|nr:unnamed protein product [Cuscuta campestris]